MCVHVVEPGLSYKIAAFPAYTDVSGDQVVCINQVIRSLSGLSGAASLPELTTMTMMMMMIVHGF